MALHLYLQDIIDDAEIKIFLSDSRFVPVFKRVRNSIRNSPILFLRSEFYNSIYYIKRKKKVFVDSIINSKFV